MERQPLWHRIRAWLLLPIPAAFLVAGTPALGSDFGWSVGINLGPPPALVSYPADLVLIPGSQVYFAPVSGVDLFFYGGNWWSRRGPGWYRSYSPDGPWGIVEHRHIPGPLYRVPADYRTVYRHGHRVPFGHWKRHHDRHDRWDRHGRWDRHDHDRDGRHDGRDGRDHRRDGRHRW